MYTSKTSKWIERRAMRATKKVRKIILYGMGILLFLLCIVGGESFSKYIMQVQGRGIIQVANWNFLVNGQSEQITNISLAQNCNLDTLKENCIAPGTAGSFQIVINAEGCQTGVDYHVKFENESGKPTNLKFSYEGEIFSSLQALESKLDGKIVASAESKTVVLDIQWFWNYETGNTREEIKKNDEIDTKEAKQIRNYTFDVVVTGIQQEPIAV